VKISIITVCRNSESTIRDTILSVLNQDFSDVEYIVVDGNSSDGTMMIISEYKDRIFKIIHEPDQGLYDAMNKGIKNSSGGIIGILNSDDVFNSCEILSSVSEVFEKYNPDCLYGDLVYVDAANLSKVVRYWKAGSLRHDSFLKGWMPPHPTFFVKKAIYQQYGSFNTTFKISADYEILLRFLVKFKLLAYYFPFIITRMRVGGVSNSSISNRLVSQREDRRAWEINSLKPYFFTIAIKPLRKVLQFLPFLFK